MPNRLHLPDLIWKSILAVGDIVLMYLSLWLSLNLRYGGDVTSGLFFNHAKAFTAAYMLWLVLLYINNLYSLTKIRQQTTTLINLTQSVFVATLITVLVFYLLPHNDLMPKSLLAINALMFWALSAVWRFSFYKLSANSLPIKKAVIIGITNGSLDLAKQMVDAPARGYKLMALAHDGQPNSMSLPNLDHVQSFEKPEDILPYIKEHQITTIIFSDTSNQELLQQLFNYLPLSVQFYNLPDFYEEYTNKLPISELSYGWFLKNLNYKDKQLTDLIKETADVLSALIILIITFPILALLGWLITLGSPGPVIYKQKRLGKDSHEFTIYKLRTMTHNAERTGPQWSQIDDPRVTRIGRFLRRTRLDELPQLYNIIKGDMSFVGPRPERPEFVNSLLANIPFYQTRNLVKPGLTGWAQVNFPYGSSVDDAIEKLQYDLYYIKHQSLSLDLSILIRTIITVLGRQGR